MPKVVFKSEALELEVPKGTNLRKLMLQEKIALYPYLARYVNCHGFGQCGTCRVRVSPAEGLSSRTKKELGQLPGRDDAGRRACQACVEGDCRVLTLPEEPAPWYRHPTYAKLQVRQEV